MDIWQANWIERMPVSVRVGPFDVRIKAYDAEEATADARFGAWTPHDQVVRVDVSRPPWKIVDTLLHELNHAVFWVWGIEDEDKEERIVGQMATAWAAIFRDNPVLLTWISELANFKAR